jgi:hypothetical protein
LQCYPDNFFPKHSASRATSPHTRRDLQRKTHAKADPRAEGRSVMKYAVAMKRLKAALISQLMQQSGRTDAPDF